MKPLVAEKRMAGSRSKEISSLTEKVKMLERKLHQRDLQIKELEKERTKIIKSKDKATKYVHLPF